MQGVDELGVGQAPAEPVGQRREQGEVLLEGSVDGLPATLETPDAVGGKEQQQPSGAPFEREKPEDGGVAQGPAAQDERRLVGRGPSPYGGPRVKSPQRRQRHASPSAVSARSRRRR
ncbi:hypothetical protein GCM10020219_058270 [Nonomuraea dietziae]